MVYFGGKPSTGCPKCRSRKIKCDREPGGCLNCRRKGFECLGYRNELDLKFRDETRHIVRKSKDKEAKKRESSYKLPLRGPTKLPSPSVEKGSQHTVPEASESERKDEETIERGMFTSSKVQTNHDAFMIVGVQPGMIPLNFDDQALTFFFSNHVIGKWRSAQGMNAQSYGIDDTLFSTIKAVGLAGISGFIHGSRLKLEARKRYLTAIQHVNSAIESPEKAKRDSTLLSIILLSQVEAIDCYTSRSLTAWENHVKGAAAVIKLRGTEKLRNPLEIRLFAQAVTSLIVCCMRNRIHLPDYLFDLVEIAAQYMDATAPGWNFFRGHMLTAQFLANVHHNIITDPAMIIQEALTLDGMMSSIFTNAGSEWRYETIFDDTHPDIVPLGYYHRYPTLISSQTSSGMLSARVDLHEIIRETLLKGCSVDPPVFSTPAHTAQFRQSTNILYQLQSELIANVSQYLLVSKTADTNMPRFPWTNFKTIIYNPSLTSASLSEDVPLIRSIGGYVLPWVLYKAGKVSVSTMETRREVIRLLRFTGSEMGIQQAFMLAEELEAKFGAKVGS